MSTDPRFVNHNVTVQQVPPSRPNPKKRLSHATKFQGSGAYSPGTFQSIAQRDPRRLVAVVLRRRKGR